MRRLGALVTAVVAALAWAGGAGADDAIDRYARFDERTFAGRSVTEDGEPRPLVEGTRIKVWFRDGGIIANAGCNTMGARVIVGPHRFRTGELSSSAIGCEPELAEQDDWLGDLLAEDPYYRLRQGRLRLRIEDTVIRLHEI